MEFFTHPAFIWTVVALVGTGILLIPLTLIVASRCVYFATLKRGSKDKWSRDLPSSLDASSVEMYRIGLEWAAENKEHAREVHTVRDGLNLFGEYYDFGGKRCAVILSGRTETLKYGYYFAIPYAKAGCNILVLDPRAHGKSDGEYNTVGFEESRDIIKWIETIEEEKNIHSFVFHGICIGAAGGMLALTSENAPRSVEAMVTEGMFPNFGESMKNHLIERHKPVFPLYNMINGLMKRRTGHSMDFGPIDVIDKLDRPLLMLHSKEDTYSTPYYAERLFEKAGTSDKQLVWFPKGRHSMLRITDTERYDAAITDFLTHLDNTTKGE